MNIDPYFGQRRTVRAYDPSRPLSDSDIALMLEAAAHAPNTGNMQVYSVIVSRSEEVKQALAPAHFNQPSVMGSQAVLTFCVDFNRFEKWCEQRKAVPGYNNFQAFMWAAIDATILAQQFVTIAEMNGLGTCYLGTTTYNARQIAEALDLPPRVVPVTTVTVGYPSAPGKVSDRLPVEGIMHTEKYHDYSPADIDRIYGPKEALEENAAFIAENGKETLAQVFTDVRYRGEDNEFFSRLYKEFVESRGFKI